MPDVPPPTAPPVVVPQYDESDPVAPDPVPTPVPATKVHYTDAFRQTSSITLDQVTIEDCDQLWDWVRSDPDGTQAFLGKTFTNSRDLFGYISRLAEKERNGHAAFYAIREGVLLGFVILEPIFREVGKDPVATTHIYLQPDARGRMASLLPSLMSEADRLAPGLNLCVITQRQEWATMLQSAGFKSQFVLTRTSPVGANHG